MPLPSPRSGENQADFTKRCMGDAILISEFPEEDQRLAVCSSRYGEAQKDNSFQRRTMIESFHFHWYNGEAEFTEPPSGDLQGHRHKVARDKDGRVVGFEETSKHGHDVEELDQPKLMSAAEYASIKGVEIFRVGTWNGDKYTAKDLDTIIDSFGKIGFQVPVKLGHKEDSAAPAAGWVRSLRRVGDKLLADLVDLPQTLYDQIKSRAFDHVSAEIFWNLKREGKTFRRALKAVSLLGATAPGVSGLKPLREAFTSDELDLVHEYQLSKEDIMSDKKVEDPGKKVVPDEKAIEVIEAKDAEIKALQAKLDEVKKADADKTEDALGVKKLQEQVASLSTQVTEARDRERKATIDGKVKDLRLPSLREHFAALYDLATTADPEKTVRFSVEVDGERKEQKVPPIRVVDDLLERLNRHSAKLFTELGTTGGLKRDDQSEGQDPGAELERLVEVYMAKHPDVDYTVAFQFVLDDPGNAELKRAYASRSAE